jgi:hypothetical protein
MNPWVVRDGRPLDEAVVASATASQASLGPALDRLRAVRFEDLPPETGREVAP